MATKPPIGIMPRNIWVEQRVEDLCSAITRYAKSTERINDDWVMELADRVSELNEKRPREKFDISKLIKNK